MPASSGNPADSPPRRPWYRLHVSTWLVVLLGIGFFALLNVPGEDVVRGLLLEKEWRHGWPATYLQRECHDSTSGIWSLGQDVYRLRFGNLFVDVLVAAVVVVAVAALWEWRRRTAGPWWRFTLRHAFTFTTLCGLALGAWVIRGNREREIETLLHSAIAENFPAELCITPAFPRWLRVWLGDKALRLLHWNGLDEDIEKFPLTVTTANVDDIERLAELLGDSVSVVIHAGEAEDEANTLACLDRLDAVEVLYCDHPTDRVIAKIAALPRLKRLMISAYDSRIAVGDLAALGRCPALRSLTVMYGVLSRSTLKAWQSLQSLEELLISDCTFPDGGVELLFPLPRLKSCFLRSSVPTTDLSGLGQSPDLQDLALLSLSADDAWLEGLPRLLELRTLYVKSPRITDRSLAQLHKFPYLTKLFLEQTAIRGPGLVHLRALSQLRELRIYAPVWSLAGLDLSHFPHLTDAKFHDARCPRAEVDALKTQHPTARVEAFDWSPDDNDLRAHMDNLTEAVKPLIVVDLSHSPLTDEEFSCLVDAQNAVILDVSSSPIGDAGLRHVGAMTKLETLRMEDTWVTGRGLAALKTCGNLTSLAIGGEVLDDEGIKNLAAIPALRELKISHSNRPRITAERIKQIRARLPDVMISGSGIEDPSDPNWPP